MRRAAVSGTEYPFHALPVRKKKTMRDRSKASLSCGFRLIPVSIVSAAHPTFGVERGHPLEIRCGYRKPVPERDDLMKWKQRL
jgi:hypothetical protein